MKEVFGENHTTVIGSIHYSNKKIMMLTK